MYKKRDMMKEFKRASADDVIFVFASKKVATLAEYIEREGEVVESLVKYDSLCILAIQKLLAKIGVVISRRINDRILDFHGTLIIFDANVTLEQLQSISQRSSSLRKIFLIWNPIQLLKVDLQAVKELGYDVWSYSEYQCNKYGVKQINSFYCDSMYEEALKNDEVDTDIIFVGKEKGREQYLNELKNSKYFANYRWFVYLTATHFWEKIKHPSYKKTVSYSDVQIMQSKAKAILELAPSEEVDITLRTFDAMVLKKKLITNIKTVAKMDYYNKNNIFILEVDNPEKIESFLNTSYCPIDETIVEKYNFRKWKTLILNDQPLNR